jgi:hypothetical protein
MRCTGKSKQSGEQCKRNASVGSTKCKIHGGATPKGAASPHYEGKGRGRHLNTGLAVIYSEAQKDPELLSIRDDVALVEALLVSSLPRIESRESGKAWTLIRKSIEQLQEAFANENYGKCMVTVQAMRDVVDENVAHYAAEDELRTNIELMLKLKQGERKRLTDMQQMVTSEQAMMLISGLLDAVRRNVTDSGTFNAIESEFIRLTSRPNRERIEAEYGNE